MDNSIVSPHRTNVNPDHLPLPPAGIGYRRRELANGVYFTTGGFRHDAPNCTLEHLAWVPALVLDSDLSALVIASGVLQTPAMVERMVSAVAPLPLPTDPKLLAEVALHHGLLPKWGWWKQAHLDLCIKTLAAVGVTPSSWVDSGFGWHFYFLLDEPAATRQDIDAARLDNYRLLHAANAQRLPLTTPAGADVTPDPLFDLKVWDCGTRILRLPGTVNLKAKFQPRPRVEIVFSDCNALPPGWHAPGDVFPGGLFSGSSAVSKPELPEAEATSTAQVTGEARGPQRESGGVVPPADDALIARVRRDERGGLYLDNKGRTKGDCSASGYDSALAYHLLGIGFTEAEVEAVLRHKRAGHGKDDRYFNNTLGAARTQRAAQAARSARATTSSATAQQPPETPPPAPTVAHPPPAPPPPPATEPAPPPPPERPILGPVSAVETKLMRSSKGVPVSDTCNAEVVYRYDPRFKDALIFNSRTLVLAWTPAAAPLLRLIGAKRTDAHPVDEATITLLSSWLGITYELYHMGDKLYRALVALAPHHDPLRDDLLAAEAAWDGQERLPLLISKSFNLPDSPLLRAYATRWLVAAVWRALDDEGLNFKHILCFTGKQSTGKSAFFKLLAGAGGVCDETLDFDKESVMQIRESWFVEIAELAGMSKREVESFKNFISKQKDTIRLPYDRRPTTTTRRFVFGATTNEPEFLEDRTGSVRWWVVNVEARCDFAWLEQNRVQVIGEAVALWRKNRNNRGFCDMDTEERASLEAASGVSWTADATVADPLTDALSAIAADMRGNRQQTITALALLERVQGWTALRNASAKAVANAARLNGWTPARSAATRGWSPPTT